MYEGNSLLRLLLFSLYREISSKIRKKIEAKIGFLSFSIADGNCYVSGAMHTNFNLYSRPFSDLVRLSLSRSPSLSTLIVTVLSLFSYRSYLRAASINSSEKNVGLTSWKFVFVCSKNERVFEENSDHLRDNGVKLVEYANPRREWEGNTMFSWWRNNWNELFMPRHPHKTIAAPRIHKKRRRSGDEEVHENAEWELVVASL